MTELSRCALWIGGMACIVAFNATAETGAPRSTPLVGHATEQVHVEKTGIYGHVVVRDSRVPVADVEIECRDYNALISGAVASTSVTKSDAEGRFEFPSLPPSTYELSIVTQGVTPAVYVSFKVWLPGGKPIMQDLEVTGNGILDGQIIDADTGTPLAGVTVLMAPSPRKGRPYDGPPAARTTDADGRFRYIGLEEQSYVVNVDKRTPQTNAYYAPDDFEDGRYDLQKGEHRQVLLRVRRMWEISLHVVDKDGKPVTGAWVQQYRLAANGEWQRTSSWGTSGEGKSRAVVRAIERKIRFETRLKGTDCNGSIEVEMPENRMSSVELKLPCSITEIPKQPTEISEWLR